MLEGETVMEYRRTSLPAPAASSVAAIGDTALCGSCATLIRFHPGENVWRHVIVGLAHAPEPYGDTFAASNRDRRLNGPEITESEQRAIDGNR